MNDLYPLTNADINIRDPFILPEGGIFYMYGTRAAHFGKQTGGFDVYKSKDLLNWSLPIPVFDSEKYRMNREVNWAPEVWQKDGRYYMCATFTFSTGERRGTYILSADSPEGPFVPHSEGSITPPSWSALDGTLLFEDGRPYMVFCHEHVQILDGTVEAIPLSDDLRRPIGEPFTLFHGSDAYGVVRRAGERYVTDGPFFYRHADGTLSMIWSTGINGTYCQCRAVSSDGTLRGKWNQCPHLFDRDGGHGMIFRAEDRSLYLTLHCPNQTGSEHPVFIPLREDGSRLICRRT